MCKEKEAAIIIAKCGSSHKTYGIRAEKIKENDWLMTWAFPIKQSNAIREGYDKTTIKGNIDFSDDYPGCPFCGARIWTVCECGRIGCTILNNGIYVCDWCGSEGEIVNYSGEKIAAGIDI